MRIKMLLLLTVFLLAACAQAAPATTPADTFIPPTASPSPLPLPTDTPLPTETAAPTAIRTPPDLPPVFQTSLLYPLDTPHTYVPDTCQYLKDKWSSANSAPGTVVMPIMFHSITGETITQDNQISDKDFYELIQTLRDKGFQAITAAQMADFMDRNAKIPERSVLIIADDRHYREYFDTWFREYWDIWGWPVINAWISTPLSSEDLWADQEALHAEGWVDYQAHGVVHNMPMWPGVTQDYITSELQGSIDAFQTHFNKTPVAIIWPGGGFSIDSVRTARQLGYRLGFTTSPRGPVLFNWVPLADNGDDMRPSWYPEGRMEDPLLVLPRYWDTDAIKHIDTVIQIGLDAAAYAQQNKATELEYYDILCAPTYGPMP